MKNLNAEQIKKALECCTKDDCDNCPNSFGNCYSNLAGYALALIKSQEQRIKELTEELDDAKRDTIPKLRLSLERANAMGVEADKTIEELTENLHATRTELAQECKKWQGRLKIECEYTRADAVENLRTRFAVHFGTYTDKDMVKVADVFKLFNKFVEENE